MERFFFEQRRNALRIRAWRYLLKHRTSYPYISGDAFADLCDYSAYGKDGSKPLNIKKLRNAKKLFVPGHMLDQLLRENFQDINATVLICGNSDQNFTVDPVLPGCVKLWLCQNYSVPGGIGKPLPIGLENLRLGKSGFKRYFRDQHPPKITDKILLPPMQLTNPIRRLVHNSIPEFGNCVHISKKYLDTSAYFKLVSNFKYVLVCEGNGFDTHRLWECLYLGCTPVLIKSEWSDILLKYLDLPVVVVENFMVFKANDLDAIVSRDTSAPDSKIIWMQYWEALIESEIA